MKLEEAKMIFQKYFKDGPGKEFVMSVMDSIEIAPAQEMKQTESKETTEQKPKQAPKKPKICNNCGKEYLPNTGIQKICPDCKKLFADIKRSSFLFK